MSDKLFVIAAIQHPTEEARKSGARAEVVVKPDTIVAWDDNEARLIAARKIPDGASLDRVEIAVSLF